LDLVSTRTRKAIAAREPSFTTCARNATHRPNATKASTMRLNGNAATALEALGHLESRALLPATRCFGSRSVSVRNLELVNPIFTEEATRSGPTTLLAALDVTVTGMAARLLRSWILRPLIDRDAIEARLGAVAHLLSKPWCAARFAKNCAASSIWSV